MTRTQDAPAKHDQATASRYDFGSRISTLFAEELVQKSGIAQSQKPLLVFDDACGTGAVSSTLHRTLDDETTRGWQLTCGDVSEAMVEVSKQKMNKEGWRNAEVKVVDAQDTTLPDGHYTHVFSAFAFNLFPDDRAAMKESSNPAAHSPSQYGPQVSLPPPFTTLFPVPSLPDKLAAVWTTLIQSAIASLPGNLPTPSTKDLFCLYNKNWADEAGVRAQFEHAGFADIKITTVGKAYPIPVEDLAEACKISLPHVTRRFWTEEQREKYEDEIPKAVLRILEEKVGKNGVASMEAEAIIATARKL
ncbi:class I SAM-dependent methyltransferase [Aspergillus clavatus NRRL 1]|uniref:Methyltransferase domain-containing protein n=1 Tax=Aspergillus clavatus (strain ATCC 1007 / CBS 513.65 / DSM 816 / NCTC 3887 / NRRL 1 / QM 1276 / 107) TaxID=344612 RepID=A1C8H7_ASPCL|nr:uncharacterized protein ACLA_043330 [Aspergillus clavatus NRRL 1]EAW13614.1 conserved hypothetical protein [Aspergillus clavatus NRRL 1]